MTYSPWTFVARNKTIIKMAEDSKMKMLTTEQLIATFEDTFQGYEICIENNPDIYRGGFEWSVSKDDGVWDSGLSFDVPDALSDARDAINNLLKIN